MIMNEAPTFSQDCPSSDGSTDNGSSPAAAMAQDYHHPNPESQESDLLNGAEHEHPPKISSVGRVVDFERASIQGSIVLSSTNDSRGTSFSNHPQANDDNTSNIESCVHSQALTNGNLVNESTNLDISADQITNADSSESQGTLHGCPAKLPPRWKPSTLRRPVLLGFSGLLLLIIAGLEVLCYVSNENQGLATVVETRYYLWKFGLTSVFTMFATFWTNVEYRTKQIMPWMVMAKNRSGSYGSEGFTLNYLTASTPGALYKSLKSRHFPVAIGLFGTLALKLVVILSTGLLITKDQVITTQIDILALDKFDLSKNSSAAAKQFSSLRTLLAIHKYGLPYPSGTSLDFATQSFSPLGQAKFGDVSTEAEVFEASLKDCMAFNNTNDDPHVVLPLFPADVSSRISSFCFDGTPAAELGPDFTWSDNLYVLTPCSNMTSEDDSHLVFTTADVWVGHNEFGISQSLGIVCQPTYSLSRRRISGTTSLSSVFQLRSVSQTASETLPLGLPPVELTKRFIAELDISEVVGYLVEDLELATSSSSITQKWYGNLLYCFNITSPEQLDFTGSNTLQSSFERFFRSTMALYVRSYQSVPLNLTTTGNLTSAITRLYTGEWSLRFIQGCLGLLFILSTSLLFYKYPLFSRDPAPLAVQTMFLAKNPFLKSVLKRIENMPYKSSEWSFPGTPLYYSIEDGISTSPSSPNATLSASLYGSANTDTNSSNATAEHFHQPEEWRQITASWVYRVTVLVCTVLVIISLEVLFYISKKNKGISNISNLSLENYAWTSLPSLLMASIAFAYSSLDCTARILDPFQKLDKGNITFKELFWEPMGTSTIHAIVQSASVDNCHKRPFTTSSILYETRASFSINDWFAFMSNHGAGNSFSVGRGQLISNALEFGNLSFAQWTYEDLLFPEIRLNINEVKDIHVRGIQGLAHSMTARLPSIRPQMNCTVRGIWDQAPCNDSAFNVPSIPECLDKGPTMSLRPWVWMPSIPPHASYLASKLCSMEDYQSPGNTKICLDTINGSWFAVARVGHGVLEDVSLIQCAPYIDIVHTFVNFTLPNYTIDHSQGQLRPDEADSNRRTIPNTYFGLVDPSTLSNPGINELFRSVVYGKDGIPLEELLGRTNADRLINRMQRVYGQVAVQLLNEYRIPITPDISAAFPDLLDPSTFNATVSTHKQRLVQSAIATRILEGILGTMALCAAIHFALTPKTRLLPYDPGSIAAKMKLFAGSRLVWMIRERNGELDDALLGEVRSLGWWDEEQHEAARSETGERKRRFGIDVGVAAKEE